MDKETDTIKVAGKPDTATLNHKSQMGLLGINLGLQWSPLPEGRLQPYIHAGGRFTSPTSSAGSLISVSRTDGEKYLIDKSYTRVTSFSLLAGAGLAFKLNKYIGINLEANYIADLTGNGTLTTTVKKYDDLNTQPSHVVAHDIAGINQLQVTGGIKFFLQ